MRISVPSIFSCQTIIANIRSCEFQQASNEPSNKLDIDMSLDYRLSFYVYGTIIAISRTGILYKLNNSILSSILILFASYQLHNCFQNDVFTIVLETVSSSVSVLAAFLIVDSFLNYRNTRSALDWLSLMPKSNTHSSAGRWRRMVWPFSL